MKIKKGIILLIFIILATLMLPNIVKGAVDDEFELEGIKYRVLSEEENNYTVTVFGYEGTPTSVVIPETVQYNDNIYLVTELAIEAFNGCTTLESVVMPNSITSTWYDIFRGCTSLKDVTLSNSLRLLQYGIFAECTALENIVIPESVKTVDMGAFENCTLLKNVKILNLEAKIDDNAFKGCTALEKIEGYIRSTAHTYAEKQGIDFEIIGKFDITFDANGGIFSNKKEILTITSGDYDIKLYEIIDNIEEPKREGYKFLGFFNAKKDGKSLEYLLSADELDKAQTLYAQWEKIEEISNKENIEDNKDTEDIKQNEDKKEEDTNSTETSALMQIDFIGNSEKQKFIKGTDKTLTFILDNDRGYGKVFVNGVELSEENGDYKWHFLEGIYPSIILSEEYMKTLKPGKYTIKFEIENVGGNETTFTVVETKNPPTGDSIIIYMAIFVVSIIGIAAIIINKNKETKD